MWDLIESVNKKIKRDDPRTWKRFPGLSSLGLLSQALGPAAWKNRANEGLHGVFSSIIGRKELLVSVDNWGVMRPTRDVPDAALAPEKVRTSVAVGEGFEGTLQDKPDWKTTSKWLHWDLNPFLWLKEEGLDYQFLGDFIAENNGSKNNGLPKLQGMLNLVDATPQDGGFLIVPGFQHHIKQWIDQPHLSTYERNHQDSPEFVEVPPDDPMQNQTQKIPMKAGDFIIWSSEMPHQNFENDSNKFRMVQYIKMFERPSEDAYGFSYRKSLMRKHVPEHLQQTEIGKLVFGL
uniref:Uncharacterized protein n=1 Tax=Arcella intermedia TaxID=1963864 RepID=A0A6B2L909_9EUKA